MGQTQPTQRQSLNRSSYKSAFEQFNTEYVQDDGLCCLYQIRRPINKEQVWKDYMLKQLSEMDLEQWPALLHNHLQAHNDIVGDTRFRENLSDPRLSQYQRKTFNESIKMRPAKDRDVNVNDSAMTDQDKESVVVTCRILNRGDTKDMNQAIKTLLEATGLLEEKLLPSCYQEIFEPRMIEDRTRINNSMAMSDVSRYSNENLNVSRNSRMNVSDTRSVVSGRNLQSYKNNTVLNQLGSNYQERKNTRENIDATEMQDCLLYYKQVTGNIEKHLKHEKNIFRQLIGTFEEYFVREYQNKAFRMKDTTVLTDQMARVIQKATVDLQHFIFLIYNGINLFYDLQNLPAGKFGNNGAYSIFNDDNLSNFVTTLIFNEEIYNIILSLYNTEHHSLETAYREQLENARDLPPEDLDVADEYCLNQKSVEYFRSRDFVLKERANSLNNRPYENAIAHLQALSHQKSPIHKSKTLLKTVELITKTIDRFYKDCGVKNTKNLTGEHVFPILCYIIVQSGITDVFSHCKIINEFSTSNIRSSMAGYYTSTLEIVAKYISNLHLGIQ